MASVLSRVKSEVVTVIYKSPQDRAPSDPAFITLSFIDTASARQACLLFPEHSCLGAFAVPASAPPRPGMLSSPDVCSATFLSFSRPLVTCYFLKEALRGYLHEVPPVLDLPLPPHPASVCFMTLRM